MIYKHFANYFHEVSNFYLRNMDKALMLEQLINYYTDGNKSKFANMLDVKPQTINTWLTRKTFDAELIYSKCDSVSGDWLLSGDGDMIKTDIHFENINSENVNKELLELCKSLVANFQQRDDVMNKLVSMVKGIE